MIENSVSIVNTPMRSLEKTYKSENKKLIFKKLGKKKLLGGYRTVQEARNSVVKDLFRSRHDPIIMNLREKLKEEKEKLLEDKRLSLIDSLTGLPNHRAVFGDRKANPPLIGRLAEFISYTERNQEPLALAIIDIDYFKKYNDKFGHPAGDIALQEFARIIRKVIRPSDFAARFGGEEFLVILPGINREQAHTVIERLRKAVAEMPSQGFKGIVPEGVSLLKGGITISAGLTDFNGNITPNALVQEADDLLYLAKNTGRNKIISRNTTK